MNALISPKTLLAFKNLKQASIYTYLLGRYQGFYNNDQKKTGRKARTTIDCMFLTAEALATEIEEELGLKLTGRTVNRYITNLAELGLAYRVYKGTSINGNRQYSLVIVDNNSETGKAIIKQINSEYTWQDAVLKSDGKNRYSECWVPQTMVKAPETSTEPLPKPTPTPTRPEQAPSGLSNYSAAFDELFDYPI